MDSKIGRSHILGGYFALLAEFWMNYFENFTQIQPKYQLYENNRTIGDMDFLFFDKNTQEWTHWEIGVKFFLLEMGIDPAKVTQLSQLKHFVGSHSKGETLLKFILKTQSQLNIKDKSAVTPRLVEEGKYPTCTGFLIKGYLFYPITEEYYTKLEILKVQNCKFLNPDHLSGWWAQYPKTLDNTDILVKGEENSENDQISDTPSKNAEISPKEETCKNDQTSEIKKISRKDKNSTKMERISKNDQKLPNTEENYPEFDENFPFPDILLLETTFHEYKQEKLKFSKFVFLEKKDFLVPLYLSENDSQKLLNYQELKIELAKYFSRHIRSLFIAEVIPFSRSIYRNDPNSVQINWVEISRGWIVHHQWRSPGNNTN